MRVEFVQVGPEAAGLMAATRPKIWATTYRGIYPDQKIDEYDLKFYTDRDRQRMEDPAQTFVLAMDRQQCVGYFHYGPPHITPHRDFVLCLNSLYFLEEYRGQGLGRRVFDHLRQVCRERGLDKFFCQCNCHNLPAQRFYENMGGLLTVVDDGHPGKDDDQLTYEFYLSPGSDRNLRCRRAAPGDGMRIAATRQKCWDATYRGVYPDEVIDAFDYDWHADRDEVRIACPDFHVYMVLDGPDCVGYYAYGPAPGRYRDFPFVLMSLYLLPAYQGRGLGSAIFRSVCTHARALGFDRLYLECNPHNPGAMAFYRRLGGHIGATDGGHENPQEDTCYFEFYL